MVKLIRGNWYEANATYDRWIFKFVKMVNNKYWTSKACTPKDNYKFNSLGTIENLSNLIPANMEEVYKFYPEEKLLNKSYELW